MQHSITPTNGGDVLKDMKRGFIMVAGLLAFAALPAFAVPITSFPECPAVGADTSGCELLITITAVNAVPGFGNVVTAFTVTTSNPNQGSYDGDDGTLIGVLNDTSGDVNKVFFAVAPGVGSFDFDLHGACVGTGSPLASPYTPGPTAAECLNGQYWTTDAMDYTSLGVTFLSFNLADAGIIVGEPSGILAPGASTWFSLPGTITASEITIVIPTTPTPEPASMVLIGTGLSALYFIRRRKA